MQFYEKLLGVSVERTVGDFLWQLRVGGALLDIIRADNSGAANMDHFCLRITPFDTRAIESHLRAMSVDYDVVGEIYGAQGYGPSIYLIDPEGNRVELKRHQPGLV